MKNGVNQAAVYPAMAEYISSPGMAEYISSPGMAGVPVHPAMAEYVAQPMGNFGGVSDDPRYLVAGGGAVLGYFVGPRLKVGRTAGAVLGAVVGWIGANAIGQL